MKKIKTALIGLGNIGALYDINDPSNIPRTHLKAILGDENFEIIALVEPNTEKRTFVAHHYDLSANLFYETVDCISKDVCVDFAVFAVPPKNRLKNLRCLHGLGCNFFVFEKPLAEDLAKSEKIIDYCEKNSIEALVNFQRRYDEGMLEFKSALPKNEIPEKVVVHYSKGIKNYGSHAIDLLLDYFGDVKSLQTTYKNNALDPLIDGVLYFEKGMAAHFIGHNTNYDLFEFEFFYKNVKFTLANGTTQKLMQKTEKDLIYKNYAHLSDYKFVQPTKKINGLSGLYKDIGAFLNNSHDTLTGCRLADAKKSMVILENLLKFEAKKYCVEL